MSGIKIKAGAGTGSTELQGPANTNNNTTLKLPSADGSANQLLKTDGSGNLGWATDQSGAGGLFASYAVICDEKSSNTAGGTLTANQWQVRDLNTEVYDPDGIVSISSDKFTLAAGTYYIQWRCPAYRTNNNGTRLYDVTNSAVKEYGMAVYANYTGVGWGLCTGATRLTISGSTEYRVEHRSNGTNATYGCGVASETGEVERYLFVEIWKEA